MENIKGFIDKNTHEEIKVSRVNTTHTAINYRTNSKKEGSLFSISAIRSGQDFTGYIDDCGSGMLYSGKKIYIGKYSSNGFGKASLEIQDDQERNVEKAIERFNDIHKTDNGRLVASVLFLSDAKLNAEQKVNGIMTTDEYKQIWLESIFGRESVLSLEKIYLHNYYYRGFDTSEDIDKMEKDAVMLTKMGTSALVSFAAADKEQAVRELVSLEQNGVGEDTGNGFGQVQICSDIHMEVKNDKI